MLSISVTTSGYRSSIGCGALEPLAAKVGRVGEDQLGPTTWSEEAPVNFEAALVDTAVQQVGATRCSLVHGGERAPRVSAAAVAGRECEYAAAESPTFTGSAEDLADDAAVVGGVPLNSLGSSTDKVVLGSEDGSFIVQ